MAFGKAVTAETLQLVEGLFRELAFVALGDHAGDQLVAELRRPRRYA